jgi:hypothetical protein
VIATLGVKLFDKKDVAKDGVGLVFTQDQIKQMQDIIDYIEKNDWTLSIIESFIETLPKCVALYKKYENLDNPIKAAVLGQLVV